MRRFWLRATLAVVLVVGAAGSGALGNDLKRVPDVQVRSLDGKLVRLSKLTEKGPVLLNFWATWCAPCQKELPYLEKLFTRYRERGFSLLAISEDGEATASRVRSLVRGRRFHFTVVLDRNQELSRLFRVSVLPTSLLIGKDLQVLWEHVGYTPGDERELEEAVIQALKGWQKAE